jgi:arylsulfatase A-like enzyme
MVHSIDEQVGRMVGLLAELGISEETIVVFTSDHGEMFTSQGRMYKTTFHTEAATVPLLIRDPAAKHGRRTSGACINTPDLAPTLLGLLGLAERIPEEMEGADLSFIVRGEAGTEPPFAFLQGTGHTYQWIDGFEWRAIRSGRFTYARYLKDGAERLYDRQNDPHEIRDLSTSEEFADIRAHLRLAMAGKMADLQDGFHPCTWYRDRWMHRGYSIRAAARGEFGPLPPIEPQRTE